MGFMMMVVIFIIMFCVLVLVRCINEVLILVLIVIFKENSYI